MKELLTYLLTEVKAKRLSTSQAVNLMKTTGFRRNIPEGIPWLHPLLQQNHSNLYEQKFRSTFTGREFFLADHQAGGMLVMPGVAALEMASAAAALATMMPPAHLRIHDTTWVKPLILQDGDLTVGMSLDTREDGSLAFTIVDEHNGSGTVCCQGIIVVGPPEASPMLDLPAMREICSNGVMEGDACYDTFVSMGMAYGPSLRSIVRIHTGAGKALAQLELNEVVLDTADTYVLHPAILDAALQAVIGLEAAGSLAGRPPRSRLPFALRELQIYDKCASQMWACISEVIADTGPASTQEVNIDLCDYQGRVCVRITGLVFKIMAEAMVPASPAEEGLLLAAPVMEKYIPGEGVAGNAPPARRLIGVCDWEGEWPYHPDERFGKVRTVLLQSRSEAVEERFEGYAVEVFLLLKQLLEDKPTEKIVFQLVVAGEYAELVSGGLWAFLRTAQAENPLLTVQLIEMDLSLPDIGKILEAHLAAGVSIHVKYAQGDCHRLAWQPLQPAIPKMPWKDNGVYLITGGLGALGLIFAKEIARRVNNPVLILTGRSPLSDAGVATLASLTTTGARAVYRQLNLVNVRDVVQCIGDIGREYGQLDGILHSAGMTNDDYILNKTKDQVLQVLEPKVRGAANLDFASSNLALDFFVLFSSAAAASPAPGQSDYAAANAFMDSFAHYRDRLAAKGMRSGRSLSVNWPFWKEGGMQLEGPAVALLERTTGMTPMNTAAGIDALYHAYASGHPQVLVVHGHLAKISALPHNPGALLQNPGTPLQNPGTRAARSLPRINDRPPGEAQPASLEGAIAYFQKEIAGFIKLPVWQLDPAIPFDQYGIESILMAQLTLHLEKTFGLLPKTLFFEYPTIAELAGYFLETHKDAIPITIDTTTSPAPAPAPATGRWKPRPVPGSGRTPVPAAKEDTPIAVIAVAGKYPKAADLSEFWENLKQGVDGIGPVPKERWDHSIYFDEEKNKPGKTSCNWGGFLNGVDEFDPVFFNISPREAALTDPQERLFMETVWRLLEESGHTKSILQKKYKGQVAVYVGAMYSHFQLLRSDLVQESVTSLSSHSTIANRVSHFWDLNGPSMAIDTACSSSLVALHDACESLRKGECLMAIAGGVNLSLHPKKYLGLSLTQMLGSSRDSRSFGNGDGYLPSEGVGALLLKPLSQAIADGDTIMSVIRSTAINHNGHGSGFTMPNPSAQAQLMENNFRSCGIDPATISYVEAAANGSPMGDAIEIAGLNKAFRKFTAKEQFCAIGSVKSNIGHAESASGMSQLTKVILQLHHGLLVPTIKSRPMNPNIDFTGTPFYLQETLREWQRPVIRIDGQDREAPRRATVSSFGAGGCNAHIILEEYRRPSRIKPADAPDRFFLLPFSAKSSRALRTTLQQMAGFLCENPDTPLAEMAYTLQTGREAMPYRWVAVVKDRAVLLEAMERYMLDGGGSAGDKWISYAGDPEEGSSEIRTLLMGKAGNNMLESALEEKHLQQLALCWSKGMAVPWQQLYDEDEGCRISLPGYPFERRRCWPEAQPVPESIDPHPSVVLQQGAGIKQLLAGLLGLTEEELHLRTPLREYGLDSILSMQLLQRLQAGVDPGIRMEDLLGCTTVEDLMHLSERAKEQAAAPALSIAGNFDLRSRRQFPELVLLNGGGNGRPVFWFHAAAGGVEPYKELAGKSQRPFYGIQARGYMTNRSPLHGIQALAAYYISIIRTVQPAGPYDLGGYSLGGLISYEVTRQLQELGEKVDSIVMLDSLYGPELQQEPFNGQNAILQAVNMALFASAMQDPGKLTESLIHRDQVEKGLDDEALLQHLAGMATARGCNRINGTMQSFIRQNVKIQEAYRADLFTVEPLPDPAGVACYYFRNKSGAFMGDLAPYFLMNKETTAFDGAKYWLEWEKQLPQLHIIDVDVANHMLLLTDARARDTITAFCETLYSEGAFRKVFLGAFDGISLDQGRKTALAMPEMQEKM